MPHLVVREPGRLPFSVELRSGFSVGRDADNDLVIDDRHASRRHARFTLADGGFQINDLGSTHGTLVNREPSVELRLADGDLIQVGQVLIVFHEGAIADDEAVLCAVTPGSRAHTREDEARRLQLLYDVGRALEDSDEVLARMLDATLDVLACTRGLVILIHGAGERRIARGRGVDRDDIVLSRAILARVQRGESVLWRVGLSDAATAVRQGVQSAMAAPLATPGRALGYLYVDDLERADRFTPAELDFLTALARLCAVALAQADERRRADALAQALRENDPLPELLGDSPPMRILDDHLRKFAAADRSAVLVRGESGTGKELAARTIHARSPRASGPFVSVNCAAIPDSLIESELFGHAKGAFTDALQARRGKFALADGGTLFLDEIGDLSLVAQAKVLRALQEAEIQPLGSDRIVHVDVRIVSATNKSLEDEIAAGRFRQDLYYRITVGEIEVPPLRDRGEDVVLLARRFLVRAAGRLGRRAAELTADAVGVLRGYGWPGNVRQLQNEVERALILSEGPTIDLGDLRARMVRGPQAPAVTTLAERFTQLDVIERDLVAEALEKAHGNASEAARLLGISRIMLRRRLARFGLGRDGGEE